MEDKTCTSVFAVELNKKVYEAALKKFGVATFKLQYGDIVKIACERLEKAKVGWIDLDFCDSPKKLKEPINSIYSAFLNSSQGSLVLSATVAYGRGCSTDNANKFVVQALDLLWRHTSYTVVRRYADGWPMISLFVVLTKNMARLAIDINEVEEELMKSLDLNDLMPLRRCLAVLNSRGFHLNLKDARRLVASGMVPKYNKYGQQDEDVFKYLVRPSELMRGANNPN
jgi:hypothetical protein